jgi:hypothetical protein
LRKRLEELGIIDEEQEKAIHELRNEIDLNNQFFNELPNDWEKIFKKLGKVKTIDYNDAVNELEAFDTETDKNGDIYLIACSNDYEFIDNSFVAIKFLVKHSKKLNFFFNIEFDFNAIIKSRVLEMDENEKKFLREKNELFIGNFRIKFIQGKYFKISVLKKKDGKMQIQKTFYYFDVANFFKGSLNSLAQTYLNDKKIEIDIEHQEKYSKEELAKYCMHDAYLTKQLALLLIDTIHKFGMPIPRYFFSIAWLSEMFLRLNAHDYLKPFKLFHKSMAKEICNYAWKSYHGGLFNSYVKGYIKNAKKIDINSAYPFQIANLYAIDPRYGYWKYTQKTYHKEANYGFYKAYVQFSGYIPLKIKELTVYPMTKKKYLTYITLDEIKQLEEDGYEFSIVDGWEFFAITQYQPFKSLIYKLYDIKQHEPKNSPLYWFIKILMNAMYGKFAQTRPKVGNLLSTLIF